VVELGEIMSQGLCPLLDSVSFFSRVAAGAR
jgi:hypothetical protein